MIMRDGQTVARAFSKFLSPIETVTVNALNDIAPLLGAFVPNNIVSPEMRGLIVNPKYLKYMNAVPIQFMGNTFPNIQDYTQKTSDKWAKAVLLDTIGIQPGALWTKTEVDNKLFLRAEQSNGLDVYYDPEDLVAFAHQTRRAYKHTCLEKPIGELFSTKSEKHDFIGVRGLQGGGIMMDSFQSLDNIPRVLAESRTASIQNLKEQDLDLDDLGPHAEFNINSTLSPVIVKKRNKPVYKELQRCLNDGLKAQVLNIFDNQSVWVQDNFEKVYSREDDISGYFDRLANPRNDKQQIHYSGSTMKINYEGLTMQAI